MFINKNNEVKQEEFLKIYIEKGVSLGYMPGWVESMLTLGYSWELERSPFARRVALVSMPTSSMAAQLIALGNLRRDLEREAANNIDGHFSELLRARDNYSQGSGMDVFVRDHRGKKWKFDATDRDENTIKVLDAQYKAEVRKKGKLIPNPNSQCSSYITASTATSWHLGESPLVESNSGGKSLLKSHYDWIPNCTGIIFEDNLQRSYSGLLILGRSADLKSVNMRGISLDGFKIGEEFVNLVDLLTLDRIKTGKISRATYRNYQNIKGKQHGVSLVIADGANAFLNAINYFENSDVIGVVNREEGEDNLVRASQKLEEMKRYYTKWRDPLPNNKAPRSVIAKYMERR